MADPVSLGKRYQVQLTQTVDSLREQAVNFKQVAESIVNEYKAQLQSQGEQLQPQVTAMVDGYKNAIKDLETPVPPNAAPFLLKSYLWTSVCLFASALAQIISGLGLYAIVGAVFNTLSALVLTFVAFPAFVFMTLRKIQMSEVEREQVVLFGSLAEGVLIGALLSNRYATIYGPPVFLLPLIVGLLAHFAGAKDQVAGKRSVFLGVLLGGAIGFYVIFGFVMNFGVWYILSILILGAAAFADLQLKVASFQRGDSSPQLEQWKTIMILTTAGTIAHYIASTDKESATASASQ